MEFIAALIMFTSWAITNGLTQRYSSLRSSIENAKNTYSLYTTLHELREMVNSLAIEVVQGLPKGQDASQYRAGKHHIPEIDVVREWFCSNRMSAHQIREAMDLCTQVHNLALSTGVKDGNEKRIEKLLWKISGFQEELVRLERAAEEELAESNNFQTQEDFISIPAYCTFWRVEVQPEIQGLFMEVVDCANTQQRAADRSLRKAKRQALIGRNAALVLYVIGTLTILYTKIPGGSPP